MIDFDSEDSWEMTCLPNKCDLDLMVGHSPPKRQKSSIPDKLQTVQEENSKVAGIQTEGTVQEENMAQITSTPKKRVRKIIPKPRSWGATARKRNHQSGKSYVSRRGKYVPQRMIKTLKNCLTDCKFNCSTKISEDERISIFKSYYSLTTSTEKRHFLINNSARCLTSRPKRLKEGAESKRTYSFRYYFHINGEKVQVCKKIFIGTLSISQKPVYTAHKCKNADTNTPEPDKRGKSSGSRRKGVGDPDAVREHIRSFQKVDARYCWAKTNHEYLDSNLNITKMYELYEDQCNLKDESPVKHSMYNKIFVTEFNLDFNVPKSDRCTLCEEYKVAEKNGCLSDDLKKKYDHHDLVKISMREERKRDKNGDIPLLIFDLENVITCPRADISELFYLRKLRIYNLTAWYSVTKTTYCAIWPETMAGRKGNDLASAVHKILDAITEENELTDLIAWSDSCVPQNRNSIIANAMMHFKRGNSSLNSLTMKYSVSGHSCVQEVDNAHSQIEKAMARTDFFSPIGFIRLLKSVNRKHPFRVIQMKPENFKDYSFTAKLLNYSLIPFTQIASMSFSQVPHILTYKLSHQHNEPEQSVNIKFNERPPQRVNQGISTLKMKRVPVGRSSKLSTASRIFDFKPPLEKNKEDISTAKKKDIKNVSLHE